MVNEARQERAQKYWKSALPITVPPRNVESISVNAYVELLIIIASSRVQLMRRDSHHSMAQYITTGTTISNGVRDIASVLRLRRR